MINLYVCRNSKLERHQINEEGYLEQQEFIKQRTLKQPEYQAENRLGDKLINEPFTAIDREILKEATWIDLVKATENEKSFVESNLNISFATRLELEDIEASARFYEDEDGVNLHSFFIFDKQNQKEPDLETVAFIINGKQIYTFRNEDLIPFRLYRFRSISQNTTELSPQDLFLSIFEIKVEQIADMIETTYNRLENLTKYILQTTAKGKGMYSLEHAINELTYFEDLTSKINSTIMDTNRALSYFTRKIKLTPEQVEQGREIFRDIESIKPNNDLLFTRISFLMDAAMGLINIEQNRIMKMFSVLSVLFLPPTLIGSIYGMNFDIMPELKLENGYYYALGLMVFSSLFTYTLFKVKHWL